MILKKDKAFTLIELLVVISIIAILSSAIFVYTKSAKDDAKIAGSLKFMTSVNNILGAYNVGVWRFETADAGYDSSEYGNNCIPGGSGGIFEFVSSVNNSLGKALRVDNRWLNCGSSVLKPNLFPTTTITMEAWAKAETLDNNYRGIMTNKRGNDYGINLYMHRNNIGSRIGIGSNNTLLTTMWAPSIGTWYYIVVTYNSKDRKAVLYVNGKIERETTLVSNLSYSSANPNYFGIGCNYKTNDAGNCNDRFVGVIDDVKVYNESLIFVDVQKHYAEGLKRLKLAGLE
jgi:prepilin-type N-terminal cleavage/methylation domain-containing protein